MFSPDLLHMSTRPKTLLRHQRTERISERATTQDKELSQPHPFAKTIHTPRLWQTPLAFLTRWVFLLDVTSCDKSPLFVGFVGQRAWLGKWRFPTYVFVLTIWRGCSVLYFTCLWMIKALRNASADCCTTLLFWKWPFETAFFLCSFVLNKYKCTKEITSCELRENSNKCMKSCVWTAGICSSVFKNVVILATLRSKFWFKVCCIFAAFSNSAIFFYCVCHKNTSIPVNLTSAAYCNMYAIENKMFNF